MMVARSLSAAARRIESGGSRPSRMLAALAGCGPGQPCPWSRPSCPLTQDEDIFADPSGHCSSEAIRHARGGLVDDRRPPPTRGSRSAFFGLDANGRIVSRGTSWVRQTSFSQSVDAVHRRR